MADQKECGQSVLQYHDFRAPVPLNPLVDEVKHDHTTIPIEKPSILEVISPKQQPKPFICCGIECECVKTKPTCCKHMGVCLATCGECCKVCSDTIWKSMKAYPGTYARAVLFLGIIGVGAYFVHTQTPVVDECYEIDSDARFDCNVAALRLLSLGYALIVCGCELFVANLVISSALEDLKNSPRPRLKCTNCIPNMLLGWVLLSIVFMLTHWVCVFVVSFNQMHGTLCEKDVDGNQIDPNCVYVATPKSIMASLIVGITFCVISGFGAVIISSCTRLEYEEQVRNERYT
jgi:hypothetical protein